MAGEVPYGAVIRPPASGLRTHGLRGGGSNPACVTISSCASWMVLKLGSNRPWYLLSCLWANMKEPFISFERSIGIVSPSWVPHFFSSYDMILTQYILVEFTLSKWQKYALFTWNTRSVLRHVKEPYCSKLNVSQKHVRNNNAFHFMISLSLKSYKILCVTV